LIIGSNISKDDVTVVLPTLNEEEGVGKVITYIKNNGFDRLLVVNGYSTDKTLDVVEKMGTDVIYQEGIGKTRALETAFKHVTTPYVVVMDADCTYSAKDIERLMAYAEKYDLVIGARVDRKNIGLLNRFGNWIITWAFNFFMQTNLSDVCSGMYMLKTSRARELEFFTRGLNAEVEIAAQMAGSVTDIPVSYSVRVGKKKLSLLDGVKDLFSILSLARKHNPILLFSSIGSSLIVPSALVLGWTALETFMNGAIRYGWLFVGVVLLIVSMQCFTTSTVLILLRRMEKRLKTLISELGEAETDRDEKII